MPIAILLLLFLSRPLYAIDLGDGSDGACVWNNTTVAPGLYQCTTLTISGTNTVDYSVDIQGSANIIDVKVQGDVTISGTLNISGNNGSGVAHAGRSGPGGYDGGPSQNHGNAPSGLALAGGRSGHSSQDPLDLETCLASGASGGRHASEVITPSLAITNPPDCDPNNVNSSGAPTQSYGNPSQFHSQIRGGSGGEGEDFGAAAPGGTGGGGGGALRLISGGNIDLSGSINASGGNGGDPGNSEGGGGGGGAGGSIFLVALEKINLLGGHSLVAQGGTGFNTGDDRAGTDGGSGYIRLEDRDALAGADLSSISPAPSVATHPLISSPATELRSLDGDITSGCAIRVIEKPAEQLNGILFLALFSLFILLGIGRIKA